ncbi:GEVED domain-containing protein [Natronoflexus pectinivorans]|uniref:PKD domain-containing protein n=1 Tax=Natronoflexus pectinivorans TaxID=682526 RepID=A0A4R2GBC1_9BACT|nr:GEVED domain-containing protein [Natronoflexus pectinivorans]TCO04991.1 PKD domain-containing protein [Natronoflexus pectinivorans]
MKNELRNALIFLTFLLTLNISIQAQSSVLLNETFETIENFPSEGWDVVWSHGVEIEDEKLRISSGGIILSPEVPIDWSNTDQIRVSFRYNNTVTEELESNIPMTLYLSLWESQERDGNSPAEGRGHITNFKVLNTTKQFKTVMFSLTEAEWEHSSLVLCFNFEGGTHGSSISFLDDILIISSKATAEPIPDFSSDLKTASTNQAVSFFDLSTEAPTHYTWIFEPAEDIAFLQGTSANSANPIVSFGTPGSYSVTLVVENAFGSDFVSKPNFLTISCSAISNDFYNGHISSVTINDNVNHSHRSQYSDFSWIYNEVDLSVIDQLTISATADNWQTFNPQMFWALYIDWNNDGVFDSAPFIEVNSHDSPGVVWEVPLLEDIEEGQIKLRIILASNLEDAETSCGSISFGEIEDYSVFFVKGDDNDAPTKTFHLENSETHIEVFSSENGLDIYIDNCNSDLYSIRLISLCGQVLRTIQTHQSEFTLELPSYSAVYIVTVASASSHSVFKVLNR